MKNKPIVLFYDVETLPNIVCSWGLWVNGMLSPENIVQERSLICASWKYQGSKEPVYTSTVSPLSPLDDRQVVEDISAAIETADIIVAHNGDAFDIKWINARRAYYNMGPLPPVIQVDTKKIAKDKFYFNSNKLEYLARYLGLGAKIHTDYELWKDCLRGNEEALRKMERYNKKDVVLLEKVYNRLAPYVATKLHMYLYHGRDVCELCGSKRIQYRGYAYSKTRKYKKYQCQEEACRHWGKSVEYETVKLKKVKDA